MRITSPVPNATFEISNIPEWPSIIFKTDKSPGPGQHILWEWKISWKTFSKSGSQITIIDTWNAKDEVSNLGGNLSVKATLRQAPPGTPAVSNAASFAPPLATATALTTPMFGKGAGLPSTPKFGLMAGVSSQKQILPETTMAVTVVLKGAQTTIAAVNAYLVTKANAAGFDKIVQHESKGEHYKNGEPKKSFDNGYGLCQLTSPAPTYQQVWNWKLNIDAGLALFEKKRREAIAYLSQGARSHTADQLKYEAVCRWNGGAYHTWNSTTGGWERNGNVTCATGTQNVGWDMTSADNNGKTKDELAKRDSGQYLTRGRKDGDKWKYFGVCYADSLLG